MNDIVKYGALPPMKRKDYDLLVGAGKSAMKRKALSVPARLTLEHVANDPYPYWGTWVDYGCGKGDDVNILRNLGVDAYGYDPFWTEIYPGDGNVTVGDLPGRNAVVTLTYVINVIADDEARRRAIHAASQLVDTGGVLVVSSRTVGDVASSAQAGGWRGSNHKGFRFGPDGNRFQRGFSTAGVSNEVLASVIPSHWIARKLAPSVMAFRRMYR